MDKSTCRHESGCDRPAFGRGLCQPHYRELLDTERPEKKCTRGDCDEPFWAKGLCKKHYMDERMAALKEQKCANERCDNPRGNTGGYCPACYQRFLTYGDPNAGPPRRKRRRPEPPRTGTRSEYHVNHAMVRKERGPAWNYGCERCDEQAQTWAMKHGLSGDSPDDYMALCWSCHAKYDNFAARLPDNRGSKRTPEARERMRQAARRRWGTPGERERMSGTSRQREARRREEREAAQSEPGEGRLF